ncbi:hypothetical protein SSABA_v1c01360 [Spiroplasma sabaudiense Ar-1343]|uniref:Uncharacterized protein n=1 Tax=Spiroplasma sabaudiense Ar-1343 TaxID=1276257 RepID=W6A8R0_9MOLU|nr:hypothetical protein [Spiroplasma sabaudiense]AHI53548.1 hypothetical protein SSABA_v1c01360 [Spiroplasma sabaudiense Ar-1343]
MKEKYYKIARGFNLAYIIITSVSLIILAIIFITSLVLSPVNISEYNLMALIIQVSSLIGIAILLIIPIIGEVIIKRQIKNSDDKPHTTLAFFMIFFIPLFGFFSGLMILIADTNNNIENNSPKKEKYKNSEPKKSKKESDFVDLVM